MGASNGGRWRAGSRGGAKRAPGSLLTRPWEPLWHFFHLLRPARWSAYVRDHWIGKPLVTAVPMLWLVLFFMVPFIIVFGISFSQSVLAIPPYEELLAWTDDKVLQLRLHLSNYNYLFTDSLYASSYLYSVKVAAVSTFFCLLLGYPMAYGIARATTTRRNIFLMLIILPFWTSFLLRVYAWIGLLKSNGVINNVLMSLGIIHEPITMMQTDFAVYIGIVYSYLPFMILPLYSNLEKHDRTLLEAAADLGSKPWKAFVRITLPLSMPGIVAGSLLVFIPAVGEYVIPSLLGRTDQLMIGRVLSDEFFENRDWPVASAVAIAMLVLLVVPIMIFQRYQNRELAHK
ncbi:MAG TPA: ABC transporter permease subunit [Steroidobacteraceae bacterium]|nr:ABC transporter permease subunit [Steroidobacteraceae bacterium]